MRSMREEILNKIDEMARHTGRAHSGICAEILNDTKFYDQVKNGRSVTDRTYEKIMNWFQEHTPSEHDAAPNTCEEACK